MRTKLRLILSGVSLVLAMAATGEVNKPEMGGLNGEEQRICSDVECNHFIAPCTLIERNKGKVLNPMDEVYLNQMTLYTDRGFCAYPPRTVISEQYTKNTCLFLFVKKETCQ